MHICMYICIYVYVCIYIYIYMYTHIRTCIYLYLELQEQTLAVARVLREGEQDVLDGDELVLHRLRDPVGLRDHRDQALPGRAGVHRVPDELRLRLLQGSRLAIF